MADDGQTLGTQEPLQPSAAPTGNETRGGLYSTGFRFSDEDPVEDWAKGKTARQLYEEARQMRSALATQTPITTQTAPAQAGFFTPPSLQPPQRPDQYADAAAWQQYDAAYDAYMTQKHNQQTQQMLESYAQPLLQSNAQLARHASATDPSHAETWKRWGHEIDIQMQSMPAQYRTKQAYDLAAQFVRSNHIDEIANERAEKLAASRGLGTERSSAAGGAPLASSVSPLDELFAKSDHPWVQQSVRAGMGVRQVRESLPKMGYSEKEFVESILKDQSFGGTNG